MVSRVREKLAIHSAALVSQTWRDGSNLAIRKGWGIDLVVKSRLVMEPIPYCCWKRNLLRRSMAAICPDFSCLWASISEGFPCGIRWPEAARSISWKESPILIGRWEWGHGLTLASQLMQWETLPRSGVENLCCLSTLLQRDGVSSQTRMWERVTG